MKPDVGWLGELGEGVKGEGVTNESAIHRRQFHALDLANRQEQAIEWILGGRLMIETRDHMLHRDRNDLKTALLYCGLQGLERNAWIELVKSGLDGDFPQGRDTHIESCS